MRPAMVADLMPFAHLALQNLRMLLGIFAYDEKGGVNLARSKQVEQLRGKFLARTIIESHGHERPVHVNGAVAEGRGGGARRGGRRCRRLRHRFAAKKAGGASNEHESFQPE